jgi:hypothetical protein
VLRLVTTFFIGLLVAALPIDALSVYLLHDVVSDVPISTT